MSAGRLHTAPGAYVAPNVQVEGDVTVGTNAVVLAPEDDSEPATILRDGAIIGANATIWSGVSVGMKAVVQPGAVVTQSVPDLAIVEGNPARIVGYADATHPLTAAPATVAADAPRSSQVEGVTLHPLRVVEDLRGKLSVGEFEEDVPFRPKRYFLVFDVPTAETRGAHAHLTCAQFMVAIRGSVSIVVDDGTRREEFLLASPTLGLLVPPMVWAIQYRYSPDAILLVFASDHYDPADYVRDYSKFLDLVRDQTAAS